MRCKARGAPRGGPHKRRATLQRARLRRENGVWNNWTYTADVRYPEELLPEIRAAFDAGLIDNLYISMQDIEHSLRQGREETLTQLRRWHHYINDAMGTLEQWACFREEEELANSGFDTGYYGQQPYLVPPPYFRETPKVGRNDPCPCGSGKNTRNAACQDSRICPALLRATP